MSERNLNQLLERAVEHAPSVDLGGEELLAAGKRRVRQRRTAGAGMAIGGLALAGALWASLGGTGLLGSQDVSPAGQSTSVSAPTQADPTQTDAAQTGSVLPAKDLRVALYGAGDDTFAFTDGTQLESAVLLVSADGTSKVELTVDGATQTVDGIPALGGKAVAYPGDRITIVTFPLPDGSPTVQVLGVGEAMDGSATMDSRPLGWVAALHGQGADAQAGIPSEVLLAWPDRVEALTGAVVESGRAGQGDTSPLVWSIPSLGQWGLVGPESTASTPGTLLVTGTETSATWAARVPATAKNVRLADGAGDLISRATWTVPVGEEIIAGGSTTWELAEGAVAAWDTASGTSTAAPGDVAAGTGAFRGLTFTVSPELQVTTHWAGDVLSPVADRSDDALTVLPFPGDPAHELVLLPVGIRSDVTLAILELLDGRQYLPAQGAVVADQTLDTASGSLRLLKVPAGTVGGEGGALVALNHGADGSDAVNTWQLLGPATEKGTMVVDPGLVVDLAPGTGWLLYPSGDHGDGSVLRGGIIGQTLVEWVRDTDPETADLVAVLPAGTDAKLVVPAGFRVEATQTHVGPVDGYEVFTATVNRPVDGGPAGAAYGLDTDGDGQVDVSLQGPDAP